MSSFREWLEVFSNEVSYANLSYRDRVGGSIAVVTLVSDALVAEIRHVVGAKVNWILMWNLPKEALMKLVEGIRISIDPNILWRLIGGNPRALHAIAIHGIDKWFRAEVLENIHLLYREALDIFGDREALWKEIEIAVHNIDEAGSRLLHLMLRRNIVAYVGAATPISDLPANEPWITHHFAYQVPAYYYVLRAVARRRSLDISLDDLLREL